MPKSRVRVSLVDSRLWIGILLLSAVVCSAPPVGAQQAAPVPAISAQQSPSIPVLGGLPLIGRLFQAQQVTSVPTLGKVPIISALFQAAPRGATSGEAASKSLLVSVDVKSATLGQVIELLMDQAHLSYTLESSLEKLSIGSAKLRKVPFRTALDTVLKMTHGQATYRVENDIYSIITREQEPIPTSATTHLPGTDPHVSADPAREHGQPGDPDQATAETRVNMDATNASLYNTLKLLFAQAHTNYTLDPTLRNYTVSAHLSGIPFRTALRMLLRSSGKALTYRIENGVYNVFPKPEDAIESPKP